MRMNKVVGVSAVLVLCLVVVGCGSLATRGGKDSYSTSDGYYQGVGRDMDILTDKGGHNTLGCYLSIICPFILLASIPVDLILDTALIPYDYARADRKEWMTIQSAQAAKGHGYIEIDFKKSLRLTRDIKKINYVVTYDGRLRTLYLTVLEAPVNNKEIKVYVPDFPGYTPRKISTVYAGTYGLLDVLMKDGSNGIPQYSLPPMKALHPDSDDSSIIFNDDRSDPVMTESYIVARPKLLNKSVTISLGFVDRSPYPASGHTH